MTFLDPLPLGKKAMKVTCPARKSSYEFVPDYQTGLFSGTALHSDLALEWTCLMSWSSESSLLHTVFSQTRETVASAEKHIWIKPTWSIPDASNASIRDRIPSHSWELNNGGLLHKQTSQFFISINYKHSNLFVTIRMRSSKVDTSFSSAVISSHRSSGKEIS